MLTSSLTFLSRCGERSHQQDHKDTLEYADEHSNGSYHTPKMAEENIVLLPIQEPTLPPTDQSWLLLDQENIPPCAVMLPSLNLLVPIMEEVKAGVQPCCQRILAIRNQ